MKSIIFEESLKNIIVEELSGRTGSAVARHSEGHTFGAHYVQQVL